MSALENSQSKPRGDHATAIKVEKSEPSQVADGRRVKIGNQAPEYRTAATPRRK
jgi:hypothetical protein